MHDHASFNRAYRVVFNAALGAMVAVPETARSHGGGAARTIAASAGVLLALAGPAAWSQAVAPNALPQDGKVAAGQVHIPKPTGNHLQVDQASERAIVNWKSFDIGTEASVRFVQPSASAAILNRVQSGPGSQILGRLDADAKVYVVNPAGVLFGPRAQVNVGGLTASTLGIRDDDFLNGRDRFTADGAAGSVVNQGTIRVASGGRVALVGTRVENAGQILAPGGQVVLAAGRQATLAIGANGHLQVAVDAAQVGTLVANGGLVHAEGGQVILTAKGAGALAASVVSNTGTLQARTVDGASGRILLLADMGNGRVDAGGTLDASAPNGGDGGFIETSAARVKIAPDLKVTTAAPQGKTGSWLIDPPDYTIAASGGDMTGTQLSTFLAANNVVILSSSGGTAAGNGDIHVNDDVSWSANTLTLTAARDININAVLTASGTSTLALNTATTNGASAGVAGGTVKVGLGPTGFLGRVDFPSRSGTGFLTINGLGYTVINALGSHTSTTGTDLQGMNGALGGRYALGANIDASDTAGWNGGAGFAPIGGTGSFTGTFEGLGHTITSLTINRGNENNVGLFSTIGSTGTVRNVGLTGGSVRADLNYGLSYRTGALAGASSGTIVNVHGTTDVWGLYNAGGLVGVVSGGSITGSQASGYVRGYNRTGGLVGSIEGSTATITGSHATGTVDDSGPGWSGGGNAIGGLVGFNNGIVVSSYANATVSGLGAVGGLVGDNNRRISLSHAGGSVTGESNVGGLAGFNFTSGRIMDSYATATVVGADLGTVGCCGVTNVGGLVGYNSRGQIANSQAGGSVVGVDYVGGLVGQLNGGSITGSYATASVTGNNAVGGLVGWAFGSSATAITDSYATGTVTGQDAVGGLVGLVNAPTNINRTYANNAVTGASNVGGLIGDRTGGTVTNSFWNTGNGLAVSDGGTGLTATQMTQASSFTAWTIATAGGSSSTWRIYEGHTAPLLRNFLTPLTLTPVYDGSGAPLADAAAYNAPAGTDTGKILGAPSHLLLSSSGAAGNYLASIPGLYSNQTGYDIVATPRTIATPGSAVGDVRLDNPISWTNGTIEITAANNVDLNGRALTSSNGTLNFDAGNQIRNAGSVAVSLFDLQGGTWDQVAGTLPSFSATDFRLSGGTFIRAQGGDGTTATPYQLADIYGVQGAASAGMADKAYVLAGDIDATGTATWNANAGFAPITLDAGGRFDGQGHTINGLRIDRPLEGFVGLFSFNNGTVANLGIVGGEVTGHSDVGAVAGWNGGELANVYSTATVKGTNWLGGLVGSNVGEVLDSHAAGTVTGTVAVPGGPAVSNIAGGLAGSNSGRIARSHATGEVSVIQNYAGGLVGENAGTIEDSYATGNATAEAYGAGGLVGHHLAGSITRSYATGRAEAMIQRAGGLVGHHFGAISDSYATGEVVGGDYVGGLVGFAGAGSDVTNSYATGAVTGSGSLGGLVGLRENAAATVTGSYWDTTTTGQSASDGGTGVDTAAMRQLASFAGWDISAGGGTNNVWRIYEGNTAPLLRGFLTPLAVTPAYDGSGTPLANAADYTAPGGADASRIFAAADAALVLSSSGAAGNYSAGITGLYSNQPGYDLIVAGRTIATPGSAAGDVRLDNPITWTSGKVDITATNDIDLNGQALAGGGDLGLNAGNQIRNAGAVAVNLFDLQGGTWSQVGSALPAFGASDFRISGGTFVRALGGDGSSATPYRLTDVFGLQGMDSDGMVDKHFVLDNDIAAAGTSGWNAGAGFLPVFEFDGSLDGQGHAITGLVIDRPTEDLVGLFSIVNGEVSDLALVGGSVRGRDVVGALAGVSGGEITNVSSSAAVQGQSVVGGLVGAADAGRIIGSSASGSVTALAVGGGLVGLNNSEIGNSHATGAVTVTQIFAGGLAGVNDMDGRIIGSHATGAVNGVANVGGLVGDNAGSIEGSYSMGSVQGETGVGGLVGGNCACGLPDSGFISGSYASGSVTGVDAVGGLVGHNAGDVSNSYATGAVTASESVGGLVGYADIASGISSSYATGRVTGLTDVGGLVGLRADATATVSNSFWDVQTTQQSGSDGGTGRTTAQMQAQATFTGWDFGATWVQYEGHTAPLLRSFLTALTVTANDATKTYDGQAYDGGGGVRYSFAPDTTKLLGTPSYTSGVNAGTHAIAPAGLYSHQQGYLVTYASGTLTVDPKALTVSGMTGRDKVYDGNDTAQFDGGTLVGLVGSETLSFSAQGFFADGKNVGTDKAVTVSGTTLADGTGLAGNYTVSNPTGLTADITRRPLTVGATGIDKTYDGTRDADVNLTDNRVLGDALIFQSTARFDTRNAGTGKTVNVTGIAITGGADAGNYELSGDTANTVANMDRRTLNVGATGVDKEYNRSTVAGVNITDDRIAGDQLTYSAIAHFDTWNVGTGKAVDVTAIALSGGADAGNYVVGNTTAMTTASITPRPLNVTASADDKVYNALRDADVTLADDRIVGDVFSVTRVSAEFDDKNVGNGKRVSVTGISFSGPDGANYTLVNTSAETTADITKRPLTVSATGVDKVYNGNTAADVSFTDTRLAGDSFTVTHATATFLDANVGSNIPVTVTGLALSSGDAGNYELTATTADTFAEISRRLLTFTANGIAKEYNGDLVGQASFTDNRVAGDVFSYDFQASFADKNVGTAKPLAVTGIGIQGGRASNYTLSATSANTTADITPRPLNVIASASSRGYNGNRNATVHFVSPDWIPGDDLAYTGSGQFADKNAGNGKTVAISGFGLLGADAGNYAVVAVPTTATANILPRGIAVFFTGADKEYDRSTATQVVLAGDTRLAGDNLVIAYDQAANFLDWNAGDGKPVTVTGVGLSGPDAGNYNLGPVDYRASIFPRALTVGATATPKQYDGNTSATVSLTDNRIPGDVLAIASTPATFDDRHAGVAKLVTVTGITIGGTAAANYDLVNDRANASADITPRPLHVTATGGTKEYDRTDTAGVTLADDRLAIDSFSVVGTARFDNRNAGTGKAIAVTDIRIFGAHAGNYELFNDTTNATGTITPRDVTVAAVGGSKTYDGLTDATVGFQVSGVLPLDVLAVSGHDPVAFADRHAGIDKPLQVTGITLGGADAGNYNLTNSAASTTGSIFPRTINVSAAAADKVYDGTRAADATFFHFRVAGDVFDVLGTATFADKNVGADKLVTVSDLRLDGADAGNYRLSAFPVTTLADIAPKALNVTATGVDKVYDRSTSATVNFADDRLAGDQFTVAATARFGDFNVGSGKTVSVTGAALSGADAGNYAVAINATTTANITPAPLLVAVESETRRAGGEPFAGAGTVRYVGLVPGDDASALFGLPIWGGTAQGASLPGSYSLSVSGFAAANYDIRYADGTLTLLPAENLLTSGEAERLARQSLEPPVAEVVPSRLRLTIAPDFVRVD